MINAQQHAQDSAALKAELGDDHARHIERAEREQLEKTLPGVRGVGVSLGQSSGTQKQHQDLLGGKANVQRREHRQERDGHQRGEAPRLPPVGAHRVGGLGAQKCIKSVQHKNGPDNAARAGPEPVGEREAGKHGADGRVRADHQAQRHRRHRESQRQTQRDLLPVPPGGGPARGQMPQRFNAAVKGAPQQFRRGRYGVGEMPAAHRRAQIQRP